MEGGRNQHTVMIQQLQKSNPQSPQHPITLLNHSAASVSNALPFHRDLAAQELGRSRCCNLLHAANQHAARCWMRQPAKVS